MRSDFQKLPGIIALFLTVVTVSAQESEPSHKGKFRTLGCRVTVEELSYAGLSEAGGNNPDAGKEGTASIIDSTRSDCYDRRGSNHLTFFRNAVAADGKPIRKIIAEVDLGKGGSLPLILFLPDPNRPEILRTLVVPDDPLSFPDASCRFINLTPASLAATLGKSGFSLVPAGVEVIKTGIGDKAETRAATVSLGNDQRLYSNNWVIRPRQRTMVIIYPVNGTIEVHRITDSASL